MCFNPKNRTHKKFIATSDLIVLKVGYLTEHGEFMSAVKHYCYKQDVQQGAVQLNNTHPLPHNLNIEEGYHSFSTTKLGCTALFNHYHDRDGIVCGEFIIPKGAEVYSFNKSFMYGGNYYPMTVCVSSEITFKGIANEKTNSSLCRTF